MVAGSSARQESFSRALFGGWRAEEADANERARAVLQDLGLWDRRDDLLLNLPPGDVKLVDFARLLMARPKMLLLDEPAAGVDAGSIGDLAGLIKRLQSNGLTVLVIDHNIGFVLGIADQVHVMARGAAIAQGTPSEIIENEQVIEIYLGRKT
jgi:branched-chain amino acid transport system ATP-binding protein